MASVSKYNTAALNQYNGSAVNYTADTIKVALVTSSYTPSATDTFFSTPAANEVSGTNYTAGGATIGSISATQSSGTVTVSGNNVSWSQSGTGFSTARYAIIYKSTGTNSTSPLIGWIDLGGNVGNVSGTLTVEWNGGITSGTIFTAS